MNNDSYVLGQLQNLVPLCKNQNTKIYLQSGANLRALQIKEIKFLLTDLVDKYTEKEIDIYSLCQINININYFYINIFGALDNFAWAIQHELSVIEGAQESNSKKHKISLFKKDFLEELKKIDDEFHNSILDYKDWHDELKLLRDPAAHRLPMYCPPRIITTSTEFQDYAVQNDRYSKTTTSESSINELKKLSKIGKFEPIFLHTDEFNNSTNYHILKTITADYEPFWSIANFVSNMLMKNLTNN